MFVCIVGSAENRAYRLGITDDIVRHLATIQASNPYKLSIVSKVCVRSQNAATAIERLGHQDLKAFEVAGGWFIDVPEGWSTQFVDGHYLRSLAARAGVELVERNTSAPAYTRSDLRRLTHEANARGMTFEDVLERVEQAYENGLTVDEAMLL